MKIPQVAFASSNFNVLKLGKIETRNDWRIMTNRNLLTMNTTILAFIGDSVYEVYVRNFVIKSGETSPEKLHREAVKYVRAESQAQALRILIPELTEEELALVKRARNKKITSKPKNADPIEYKMATAFEALIGGLYLRQKTDRLEHLAGRTIDIISKNSTDLQADKLKTRSNESSDSKVTDQTKAR